MRTIIQDNGLEGGILLYTPQEPTFAELNEASANFHNYYIWNNTASVVLGDPEGFSAADRQELKNMGVPEFQD